MKLFNLKKKSKSKGFTLIEILLVVGFIALAGIGVYIVYDKVTTSQAVNTEIRNLDTLRAGAKNIYAGAKDYANISHTVLLNAKVVPDSMAVPAGTGTGGTPAGIRSSFGGDVTVAAVAFPTTAANSAFAITYAGVPADVCARFATAAAASFNRVTVGGSTVKDTSSTAATLANNAIDVGAAATGCSTGTGAKTLVLTSI